MRLLLLLLLFLTGLDGNCQKQILVYGNTTNLCYENSTTFQFAFDTQIPDSLMNFDALLIFSTAHTSLTQEETDAIFYFLNSGKGLYVGCDNWPLVAEGNQLTESLFGKSFWGESQVELAIKNEDFTTLFDEIDTITAGISTVNFPLDYRLNVEVWVNDEPLIQSSDYFGGNLILDGGYSRFYCGMKGNSERLWLRLLEYLTSTD